MKALVFPALFLMSLFKDPSIDDLALIPRKELFGNAKYLEPQISPDGKKLAYLSPNEQGVMNIWVRTIGKKDDRTVTNDQNRGIHSFFWQYDNQHILYQKDKGGDENWHLFQVHIQNERTRDLTPFEGVKAELIYYGPKYKDEMVISLNKRDRRFHDPHKLNLKDAEMTILEENPGNVIQYCVDHDLQLRAKLTASPDGSYKVWGKTKAEWTHLMDWDLDDQKGSLVGFSEDNHSLLMLTSCGADTKRLLQINLDTKQKTALFEHPKFDLREIYRHPVTKKLQAVNYYPDYQNWGFLDSEFKKEISYLQKQLSGNLAVISSDLEDKFWTVSLDSDTQPISYYLFEKSTKKLTHLFDSQPSLKKYTFAKTRPFTFQASDGMKIHGYYTLPCIKKKNFPSVMFVHGGPWSRDTWKFQPWVQWLANRGYAVVQVNYRGSIGYGKKYMAASKKQWAGKMHDDLIDAKKWAVAQGFSDPKRFAIMGGSYGGYATLVGLTFTPDEFSCGISYVGPSNLITLLKSFPPYWYALKAAMNQYIGNPDTEENFLKERSPLFKVDQIKKPLLIAQGANDPRVVQAESDQIVKAMRDRGLSVEYLLFSDEGHGFVKPENKIKLTAASERFLSDHLKGRFEKVAQEEEWDIVKN